MTEAVAAVPEAVTARRAEIRQLTGVRFLAATWVVLYHFQFMIFGLIPELRPVGFLFDSGYLAVDLFFVLSGYIIAYQYLGVFPGGRAAPGGYRRFLIKRLARIYPLQFVTLLIAIAVILTGVLIGVTIPYPQSFTVWGAIQDLLLIRGWEPFPQQGWNFPAWSLSAEWFAYLLFPAVALLIAVVRRHRIGLLLVLAGCLAAEGLGAWLLPSFNGMPHPLVRVVAGFVAGAAIFAIGAPRIRPGILAVVGLLGLALLITTAGRIELDPARAVVALLLAGVVVTGLATGGGPAIRWLSSGPLEYGGRISYGIYMIHGIVLMIFGALLAALVQKVPQEVVLQWPVVARAALLLVPLAIVVLLGALLYHAVERPAQRWLSSSKLVSTGSTSAEPR
ncbi:MAG: acyltransferase [Actinomycetota bacterium]|nr:acyltransferase [Actinomycetota bacterium]